MKKIFLSLTAVLFCALCANAADLKIAVIDMDKIFQEYYKTKIIDANLKKQAELFKDYSDKLNESLTKLQEEFKTLRDASQNIAASEAERESKRLAAQDKYRQMNSKEAELRQYTREKQRQLRDEYEKNRNEILNEIKKTVGEMALLQGYTIVLDKSGATLNNIPAVMYHNPSIDITDNILRDLNRGRDIKPVADSKTDVKADSKNDNKTEQKGDTAK